MAKFFIDRPVLSIVLSIVMLMSGLAALYDLPVEQYPQIVPPEVIVQANYPGASAETIAEVVAAPIEQQINGVEDMIYMRSVTANAGYMRLSVYFEIGTDPDQATINVNNRVQAALASLPDIVRQQGVTVQKSSSSIMVMVALSSPDDTFDSLYLNNYASQFVTDQLKRVPGVGDARVFGQTDYSMRIWLQPDMLAQYQLTPSDLADTLREQNIQPAAGNFGAAPGNDHLDFAYAVTSDGRFKTAEQFRNIIVRSDAEGGILRLGDVARVELGSERYAFNASLNGKPFAPIAIYLQPGANALDTTNAVRAKMEELSARFPQGLEFSIPYNTTKFVEVSVEEVIHTFIEALVLVVLVVFLFLQNFRATLIPLLAIPVSLVGTFAGMYLFGFSVNLLTLFGMILAIGIVVDDAIVVLENVERLMREEHLSPRDAAVKAMEEVTGPVITIVLVLCAVFIPVAFIGGLSGVLYQQFAITIAISVFLSGLVALTLTPALCAIMLKEGHTEPAAPFRWFNRQFDRLTGGYLSGVSFLLKRAVLGVVLFACLIGLTIVMYGRVPTALVPPEDQGIVIAVAQLPAAASLGRTDAAVNELTERLVDDPLAQDVVAFAGWDLLAGGLKTNGGVAFVALKDWKERQAPGQDAQSMANVLNGEEAANPDANIIAFTPPPIQGLSTTGGFEGYLQNLVGAPPAELQAMADQLIAAANARPELQGVRTTLDTGIPQYKLEVDREKARSQNVPINTVFETMQSTFGSLYVNDFTLQGRNYQVNLQAEAEYRQGPENLRDVYVRSTDGNMIPLSTLIDVERVSGPDIIERFNVLMSARIMGNPAPGYSSGQAMVAMQEVANEVLTPDYNLAWFGSAYQEQQAGSASTIAFVFGVIMVFLILAAQYERFCLPFAVVMAVPFAIFGAVLAIWLRGINLDIYFQIGLLVLIGLASKNAILIIEFAVLARKDGVSVHEAAMQAARLRFRPIVMTSLAFILGVVPLALSSGAGAASRHSIGTGVIGGMLGATTLAIVMIPLFYVLVERLSGNSKAPDQKA
ncbi:efflux RND transporter permease subunit [Oceanobacter kriegii]|uniref:efflux RND transporter permease subunit n=1 Tax=Oceanobacter kriegii TaxID=64972 RepID=UPI000400BD05|nr:multidrug efflux RND transporter permease subunit [Oceanobacter kriegii]